MSRGGPLILWLEDRVPTIAYFANRAKACGGTVELFGTPSELVSYLDEEFGPKPSPERLRAVRLGFVVDLMLLGVLDLASIGIYDAPTRGGVRAGYVFIDRYLRDDQYGYADVPVCMLTERTPTPDLEEDIQKLKDRKQGPIMLANKYRQADRECFDQFINSL